MGQKVTGGLLDEPYPIKTRGDVNRARVLPMPRAKREAPKAPVDEKPAAAPAKESEQPQSGFDYVRKRNRLMGVRTAAARRSSTRRA